MDSRRNFFIRLQAALLQSQLNACNTFVFVNFTRCIFILYIFVCTAFCLWYSVSVSFAIVGTASIYLCIYFAVIKFYALVAFALWQAGKRMERRRERKRSTLNRIRNCRIVHPLRAAFLKRSNTTVGRIIENISLAY